MEKQQKTYLHYVISTIFAFLSVGLLYIPFLFTNQDLLFLFINIMFSWLLYRIILITKEIKLYLKHRLIFYILFSFIVTIFYVVPTGMKYLSNTIDYYFLVFFSLFIIPTLFSYFIDFCFSFISLLSSLIKKKFKNQSKQ